MNEFVTYKNHEVIVKNPSAEYSPKPRRLRSFPGSASFHFAVNNFGDEFIYGINHIRLQFESMEQSRNITFWRFADGTCAFSYFTDRDNDKTRRFVKEPWELRSITRELKLQVAFI